MMTKRQMAKVLATAGVAFTVCLPVAAGAQTANYPGPVPPQVLAVNEVRPPQVANQDLPRAAAATAASDTAGDSLPVTGGDIAGLVALGLGAVATGSVLVRRSRVRRT